MIKWVKKGGIEVKAQIFIRKQILYVRFSGELDSSVANGLRVKISELIENYNVKYLVLNCAGLTFMDSSGIGFIIGRYNQLKEKNGMIIMCELDDLVKRIVKLSGINRIVNIKNTEEEVNQFLEGEYEKIHKNAV